MRILFLILSIVFALTILGYSQVVKVDYYKPVSFFQGQKVGDAQSFELIINKKASCFNLDPYEGGDALNMETLEGQIDFALGKRWLYKENSSRKLWDYQHDLQEEYYLIEDDMHPMEWSLKDSTRKIGPYLCQLATCQFRGRDYIAWFTPEIPLSGGPWKLGGLPGLILEAYDSKKEVVYLFQSISETEQAPEKPDIIGNQKPISPKEFNEISMKGLKNQFKAAVASFNAESDDFEMDIQFNYFNFMEKFDN